MKTGALLPVAFLRYTVLVSYVMGSQSTKKSGCDSPAERFQEQAKRVASFRRVISEQTRSKWTKMQWSCSAFWNIMAGSGSLLCFAAGGFTVKLLLLLIIILSRVLIESHPWHWQRAEQNLQKCNNCRKTMLINNFNVAICLPVHRLMAAITQKLPVYQFLLF